MLAEGLTQPLAATKVGSAPPNAAQSARQRPDPIRFRSGPGAHPSRTEFIPFRMDFMDFIPFRTE